jgi:DNA-binding response OmpR family regulator
MEDPIRVICVDDDVVVHHLLTKVLELAGISILACYSSAEELLESKECMEFREAELFLLDLQMPNMTGVELAAKLRAEGEQRPILLTSAFSQDFRWGLRAMYVEYLQKPYDFDELESMIKNLVHQSVVL